MLHKFLQVARKKIFSSKSNIDFGESLANEYLKRKKYRFEEKNFSIKSGEIDLIFWDQKTLVFIEVKRRKTDFYGNPEEFVDQKKQKKIIFVALYYIQKYSLENFCFRFDVISIVGKEERNCKIKHIKNAFDASSLGRAFSSTHSKDIIF